MALGSWGGNHLSGSPRDSSLPRLPASGRAGPTAAPREL